MISRPTFVRFFCCCFFFQRKRKEQLVATGGGIFPFFLRPLPDGCVRRSPVDMSAGPSSLSPSADTHFCVFCLCPRPHNPGGDTCSHLQHRVRVRVSAKAKAGHSQGALGHFPSPSATSTSKFFHIFHKASCVAPPSLKEYAVKIKLLLSASAG